MGSLILCHDKHATHPYEITRIHCKIFTLEELCYYLCNNLYLIDYTIMNEQLVTWLKEELEMTDLAGALYDVIRLKGSVEKFVLTILKSSKIYREPEMIRIQNVLEHLKNQNEVEREKYKADNLLKAGEVASAILVYQSIVGKEWDDSVGREFYGQVYGCLGSAYGRLLLYEEAAAMYEKGFGVCQDTKMLKAYLYCCYRYLPQEQYVKMLSNEPVYLSIGSVLKEEIRKAAENVKVDATDEQLGRWKKEYQRGNI